jgi:phospholipase C
MPRQEKGVRPSLPLPYELYAAGQLSDDRRAVAITMEARNATFGARSAGSPFHVYTPGSFHGQLNLRTRAYAVAAGRSVNDTWDLDGFENGVYHLCICGPNGFLRELAGNADDPQIEVHCEYVRKSPAQLTGDLKVVLTNRSRERSYELRIADRAYGSGDRTASVRPGGRAAIALRLADSHSWYDFTLTVSGAQRFWRRCAGRVETGRPGFSDPAMGNAT